MTQIIIDDHLVRMRQPPRLSLVFHAVRQVIAEGVKAPKKKRKVKSNA